MAVNSAAQERAPSDEKCFDQITNHNSSRSNIATDNMQAKIF